MSADTRRRYLPVIIVGAPRSGTNMLRDVLTTLDGIDTWPCDEINYIWRHGNVRYPSDAFGPDLARPAVAGYIRGRFDALQRRTGARVVVEKTCANCLRVPFVDRVIPDAHYVYIHRNGLDAAASAQLRWTASMDLRYLLKKVPYVPLTDLPYYATRYLAARVYRLFSAQKRVAFWGPRSDDMDEILARHSLIEACALQWQRCVDAAEAALAGLPADRVVSVRYEDFVQRPGEELRRLLAALGLPADDASVERAVAGVRPGGAGKALATLPSADVEALRALIGHRLERDVPGG